MKVYRKKSKLRNTDMNLTRRHFLQTSATGLAAVAMPHRLWAQTRIDMGDMRVDTLLDGHLTLPADFIFGPMEPARLAPILAQHGIAPGPLTPDCNVTLMRDGTRTVLFDTGSGPAFQQTAGKLVAALDAVDLTPGDITHVVFTHCHPDHLWGVLDDFDDLLFPQATHLMGRDEWAFWFAPETAEAIQPERTTMAVGARRRMEILEDSVDLFDDGDEILPGVAAHATYGHTPGHMSFELRSGSDSLLVVGDAIGNHHVGFARPGWISGSDQDGEMAAATRLRLLDKITADDMALIGYHLPDGGFGRAERDGEGYRFVPGAG